MHFKYVRRGVAPFFQNATCALSMSVGVLPLSFRMQRALQVCPSGCCPFLSECNVHFKYVRRGVAPFFQDATCTSSMSVGVLPLSFRTQRALQVCPSGCCPFLSECNVHFKYVRRGVAPCFPNATYTLSMSVGVLPLFFRMQRAL